MLAHQQGGLVNSSVLSRSLGIDTRTVNRYLDLLVEMFLVRRLNPWHANLGKRLTKSPKLYVRDSGLLHALLGLATDESLLGHPAVHTRGRTWQTRSCGCCSGRSGQTGQCRSAGRSRSFVLQVHRALAAGAHVLGQAGQGHVVAQFFAALGSGRASASFWRSR
jgi:hypothetical protein